MCKLFALFTKWYNYLQLNCKQLFDNYLPDSYIVLDIMSNLEVI
jgi:hypothetical protein